MVDKRFFPPACPLINGLPVLIDSVGRYITRNGRPVVIHEIKPQVTSYPETTSFRCTGTIYIMSSKGRVKRSVYYIWHESGRRDIYEENNWDIVAKLQD